jgi:uncharacterized protein YicC (UPF0701 family)
MPIYSMTGYASAQAELPAPTLKAPRLRLGLEIRSVNSRFLDLDFQNARGVASDMKRLCASWSCNKSSVARSKYVPT